jgi:O-methyltransferase
VECGVYRGGSAGVLGHGLTQSSLPRKLWLYDSFEGMPKASDKDDAYSHQIEAQFVGSEEQTRRILSKLNVEKDRFTIVRGRFEQTFSSVKASPVALLHVDCDFYEPVKLTLETFYPHVVPGGFVIFNDYGSFQGCRTAADEFIAANGIKSPLIQIDQDAYYFQKAR